MFIKWLNHALISAFDSIGGLFLVETRFVKNTVLQINIKKCLLWNTDRNQTKVL